MAFLLIFQDHEARQRDEYGLFRHEFPVRPRSPMCSQVCGTFQRCVCGGFGGPGTPVDVVCHALFCLLCGCGGALLQPAPVVAPAAPGS